MSDQNRIMHSIVGVPVSLSDESDVERPGNYTDFTGFTPPLSPRVRRRVRKARSSMSLNYHRNNPVARTTNNNSSEQPSTSRTGSEPPGNRVNMYDQHGQHSSGGNGERPLRPDSPIPEAEVNWFPQERNLGIMANRLLNDARANATIDERLLQCANCFLLPLMPVTGICGHTRCLRCIKQYSTCPCGVPHPPWQLNVTIVVQEIVQKLLSTETSLRAWMSTSREAFSYPAHYQVPVLSVAEVPSPPKIDEFVAGEPLKFDNEEKEIEENLEELEDLPKEDDLSEEDAKADPIAEADNAEPVDMEEEGAWGPLEPTPPAEPQPHERIPITPQARMEYARYLIQGGQHEAAVQHLARAAISDTEVARPARRMLIRVLSELCKTRDQGPLETELRQQISSQAASNWLRGRDLECVFCFDTFIKPITTPCGHTFCRPCLERAFDYRTTCALCMQTLYVLQFNDTRVTEFVCAALAAIGVSKAPLLPDPHVIPILACTVAFPGMPCPLFLFNPRYWYMIRRILESGSRKFGMVAYEREGTHSEYGTILEIRDCVHLQDGCTIVTTVGVSRFRVVEKDIWDGGYRWCDVARVEPVVDIPIKNRESVMQLRALADLIGYRAGVWIRAMNPALRSKIETAFGMMPRMDVFGNWWKEADGPAWLWWLISILPLRLEIKILILATNSLEKRMRAVLRTLDTSLAQPPHNVRDYESALADWWLQRHL